MRKAFKIIIWSIFALVLLALGALLGLSKYFDSERLTPLAVAVANKSLDAEVHIGSAELSLSKSFPFLNLEVEDLSIVSNKMLRLPSELRDSIPLWADTLMKVDGFSGGINIMRLLAGKIELSHVEISQPEINLVFATDSITNFSIMKDAEETDDEGAEMPDIVIRKFAIKAPALARYYSLPDSTDVLAMIYSAQMQNGADKQAYKIDVTTNIQSPMLDILEHDSLPVACNGDIAWNHERPMEVEFKDFKFSAGFLSGKFNATADFTDGCSVRDMDFSFAPIQISEAMKGLALPANLAKGLNTDAAIAFSGSLNRPYDLASGTLPSGVFNIKIDPSWLKWQQVDLRKLQLDCEVNLAGDSLDAARIDIKKFIAQGPATSIEISGIASKLISDPAFDGRIDGNVNLRKLPAQLIDMLPVGILDGRVKLGAKVRGSASMFSANNFHKIYVSGHIGVDDFYYVSPDTLAMVRIGSVQAKFGTNESYKSTRLSRRDSSVVTTRTDSLLMASISLDTAQMLASGIAMRLEGFKIGIGAQNKALSGDTTDIIPIGGKVSAEMLSAFSITDTAGVRIRDFNGNVSLRRYKGDKHLPLFILDANLAHISAGDNSTRMMISEASLRARMNKLPDSALSPGHRKLRAAVDSLRRINPDLPVDSVYAMAMRARMKHAGHHRVHAEFDAQDREIMDWGASRGFKRLLLDWDIIGSMTANQARLFTYAFPVRNRVENLNITFDNDSIILRDVAYKAGHSDFLISGTVSNMKRGLTSSRGNQAIKIVFDSESDTIDVNQLAQAFFTGAANKDKKLSGSIDAEDDSASYAQTEVDNGASGPFLIPVNIDANFNLRAKNVLYSDLLLKDLQGTVQAYDGALNLSDISATSNAGSIKLAGLYSASSVNDMKFGMSLDLNDFRIKKFLELVPAVDSIMPIIGDLGGIIRARIAATADVDSEMNLVIPSLEAAINLEGDSLVVLDQETFKTISKWLMFKDKNRNMINHMSVDAVIANNHMEVFPFIFDFDRYRLGVQGSNDLEMNYNYHIAVLKSPIPFKFGINIKGNIDDYKISLGKAKFNEKQAVRDVAIADTTRVNLINQFENVFKRGVRKSKFANLNIERLSPAGIDLGADTLSHTDSLYLMNQGLIPEFEIKVKNEQ